MTSTGRESKYASAYFKRELDGDGCAVTFQNDRVGLEQLKYIGVDNVMWAADYPHTEGSFGYASVSQMAVVDAVSQQDARNILGENAQRLFRT